MTGLHTWALVGAAVLHVQSGSLTGLSVVLRLRVVAGPHTRPASHAARQRAVSPLHPQTPVAIDWIENKQNRQIHSAIAQSAESL